MTAPVIGVLFVCTGNICRSPTAEGAFRAAVAAAGLSHRIRAASAGTHGYHVGEPPDPRSLATAQRFGVDLGAQRARQVETEDFTGFRYVLAADHGHLAWLRRRAPAGATARIELMTAFAAEGRGAEVGDPYYGGAGRLRQGLASGPGRGGRPAASYTKVRSGRRPGQRLNLPAGPALLRMVK